MAKRYTRINWKQYPDTSTPRNAANLNKMDKGIDDLDNAIEVLNDNLGDIKRLLTGSITLNFTTTNANIYLLRGGNVTSYANTYIGFIIATGSVCTIVDLYKGTYIAVTASGLNVTATNTSGYGTTWSVYRI